MSVGARSEDTATSATQLPEVEDPLVAALPPQTDYITYLTILEYQLNPDNLPVLNRLLKQDDGTLAAEIGWDLLKLVLPMLTVNAQSVKECLSIIARRGNPREVIVRVAEELERLGHQEADEGHDYPSDTEDGLPTFAGEAPRVHLGSMTLDGLPDVQRSNTKPQQDVHEEVLDVNADEMSFQALLSMLPPLHTRIKTKFPSRFLATSLPAALGAYRRSTINCKSTIPFLQTLKDLNPTSKPALPPRTSPIHDTLIAPASLPDPESRAEGTQLEAVPAGEAAITTRLLQAVLLEIVDEYVSASPSSEAADFSFVTQLRVKYRPWTVPSHRQSELNDFLATQPYLTVTKMYRSFVQTAAALNLMVPAEIQEPVKMTSSLESVDPDHEYPTTPSEIPFSRTGLLLLLSIQQCLDHVAGVPSPPTQSVDTMSILGLLEAAAAESVAIFASPATTDLVLGLVFIHIIGTEPIVQPRSIPQTSVQQILSVLQQIFTTNSDTSIRDNAHYLATHIFHSMTTRTARVDIIRTMLHDGKFSHSSQATNLFELNRDVNLQVVAINWLKDELFPSLLTKAIMRTSSDSEQTGLLSSTVLDLIDHLFQQAVSDNDISNPSSEDLTTCTAQTPLYIASINLFCLLIQSEAHSNSNSNSNSNSSAEVNLSTLLVPKINSLLVLPRRHRAVLLEKVRGSAMGDDALDAAGLGIGVGDIFALDDALSRVEDVMGRMNRNLQ